MEKRTLPQVPEVTGNYPDEQWWADWAVRYAKAVKHLQDIAFEPEGRCKVGPWDRVLRCTRTDNLLLPAERLICDTLGEDNAAWGRLWNATGEGGDQ
jgi:hypothetical protein